MLLRNTLLALILVVIFTALSYPAWAGKDKGSANLTQEEKDRLNAYVLSLIRKNQDVPPPPPPPPPPERGGGGAEVKGGPVGE